MSKEIRRISLGEGQPDIIVKEVEGGKNLNVKFPVYIRDFVYMSAIVSEEILDSHIEFYKNAHPRYISDFNNGKTLSFEIP